MSMAGIASNLVLAVFCTLALALLQGLSSAIGSAGGVISILIQAAFYGLYINLILAVFNLIPIPPLDGSHVVYHLLPLKLRARYQEFGRYGIGVIMLLVFVVPDGLELVLWPVTFLVELALAFVAIWV